MSRGCPSGRRSRALVGLLSLALLGACGPGTTPPGSGTPGPAQTLVPSASSAARPTPSPADAAIEVVAAGLDTPVGLVGYPGHPELSLVWEQSGTVRVLRDGRLLPDLFLDLRTTLVRLMPDYDERGLQSLAFHPDFVSNGRLFVYYAVASRAGRTGDHTNRLSELRVDPADPLHVVAGSERAILEFEQPQFNHSGGGLGFGPDGFLYLGTGDGGGEGDASPGHPAHGNGQDPSKLNGKVLRIDVDHPDGKSRHAILIFLD